MARPLKEGLTYFPIDVDIDQDDKLAVVIAKYGMQGFGIIIKLMMEIYKNGYYYPWTEKEQYIFSSKINTDIVLVQELVNECIKWQFFNEGLYNDYSILTSRGIQKRYLLAVTRRKESSIDISHDLVNVSNNSINASNNLVNDDIEYAISTQSKVNEIDSKEKSKEIRLNKQIYRKFDHLTLYLHEYERIKEEGYTKQQIDNMLDSIENYKKNTAYKSLNLTLKKWLKKEEEDAKLIKSTKNTGLRLYQTESERKQIKSEVKPSKYFTPEMYEM
jgi:hypothetical protein